jgi:hypothetical protein
MLTGSFSSILLAVYTITTRIIFGCIYRLLRVITAALNAIKCLIVNDVMDVKLLNDVQNVVK